MTGLNPDHRRRILAEGTNHRPAPGALQYAGAPKERKRNRRVEIDKAEYDLLRRITGAVAALYPAFEQTGVPVMRPTEFELLRTLLKQYVAVRSADPTDTEVIAGLTDLLRDLG